ncbi:aminopeptidase PepB [Gallaecimonas mangrovi]|uniref:aminopeptidase PepB n=1 Tax=Gallaecimonas mangrovi TaxID=2291597 RepID=UPI000E203E48|nr:aminopeptidase PepB [Gallaecimonas mangrovi]
MSEWFEVTLTGEAAASQWGDNALISFKENGATVHASDRRRIQQAGSRLRSQGIVKVQLATGFEDIDLQWAFADGFMSTLGGERIRWASESAELDARFKVARWVRDITNKGPEQKSPQMLASEAASFISALGGDKVSYKMISGEALKDAGWTGLYNVGRGSSRPPVMLVLDYNPGQEDTPVSAALVGKGIVFDSGGYSLKASEGMLNMKADMGGAAMVTGGLGLAILRGLDKRVRLILCCAENLVSGNAYKLGDILTYKNGTTVEVVNTDAEGRLVLADGLLVAGESGAPLIINAATLTGAAMTAVGSHYNALFALDKEVVAKVNAIADAECEPAWPLPLEPFHQFECPSAYADTANSRAQKGGGAGGASNAAGFLSRFVRDSGKGWVHMDLASCFNNSENALWAAGATARGIRTIASSIKALS